MSPMRTPRPTPNGPERNCRRRPSGRSPPAAVEGAEFAWGDSFMPGGQPMANIWQGDFPYRNLKPKGRERTTPVKAYPPNGHGLYDMKIGRASWRERVGQDV